MIIEQFVEWEKEHTDYIFRVQDILIDSIPDDPEGLIAAACEIEAHNGRIGSLLAESNSWLDRSKMLLRPDKEYGSELDRRTELDGLTAPARVVRDKLESLASCIKQRLILCESLLAYHRQFVEHKGKVENPF